MSFKTAVIGTALFATTLLSHAHDHAIHWSYEGEGAAAHWGELEPGFATCKTGKEQSPIDIRQTKKSAELKPLSFNYGKSAVEVLNNGHTIQVNLANGGTLKLGDKPADEYQLLQFHFHTPSEENIGGQAYPLVAHLVHKNATGQLAVVAILFELGKENAALRDVFNAMPTKEGASVSLGMGLNASDILPTGRSYYAFKGSLTTPPCSEGVRWQVLKQTVEISREQFASFKALYPFNARPIQPQHGRVVRESK